MDPSIREGRVGTPQVNTERPCWAISTLNEEVWALFPETPVEYSDVNGRNTALAVTYDLTALDGEDQTTAVGLLNLIAGDLRVEDVLVTSGAALVQMRPNPRTQDTRDPFGLSAALLIMAGADEPDAENDLDIHALRGGITFPTDGGTAETEDGAFSDPALHAAMTDGGTAAHTSSDTMEGGGA